MQIGQQIKKYRQHLNLSQDGLADKVYVTRQTISNWENNKSYPDINSLLLLSNVFSCTLDELVKGDVEKMKEEIQKVDLNDFNRMAKIFGCLMILMIFSFAPLVFYFRWLGIFVWIVIAMITFHYAFKVEKMKKQNDIQTYKEITAFFEGKKLDEISKQREIGKRNYQKVWLMIGSGALMYVVCEIMFRLLSSI